MLEAYRIGYRVTDEGLLVNRRGRSLRIHHYNDHYPKLRHWSSIEDPPKWVSTDVHRLAAYCFFGDSMFEPGILVRHLDGNVLNVARYNIALGTKRDNSLDVPLERRKAAAARMREFAPIPKRGYRGNNAKLTDDQVRELRSLREDGVLLRDLSELFGICQTGVSLISRGVTYPYVR